jgi:hypothetical protein
MDNFKDLKIWKHHKNTHRIVLNKHFLFIQIPKTSSSSILKSCIKKGLVVTNMNCYRHEGLLYLENFIDEKLPVYAVVRNPFNHIFSYFFHKVRWNEIKLDDTISLKENFENFVIDNVNNDHLRQCDYIKSNKNIKVNLVKFEDKNIANILNNKFNVKLDENNIVNENDCPKYIESKKDIKSFFTNPKIIDLIIKERSNEFETFKYSTNVNDIK